MSSSQCPNKQPERHGEYYIPSGDFFLLVDNTLFRVHAYFFDRDSEKFRKILGCAVAPNQIRIGSSDSKPFPVKNSSPAEFAKFLWMFYNTTYSDYSTATITDWTSILKVACEYDFIEVQHAAIRGLQTCTLTTVERIQIYELYKAHSKYLVPLYVEMAMRDEAPSNDEVAKLGSATALLIFRLREYLRARTGLGGKSPLPADVGEEDARQAVCAFLKLDYSQFQSSASASNCANKSAGAKGRKPGHGANGNS
ncbi:hypothetical protein BDN70DRAFT_710849 [Pholiota conissans]|uniref:BTB domain-containing protein n=1 Tax=Pholiota conissans TaxID=109636 RepID=A0A9P6D0X1_9AGAR|nr:hypothetical protein BDN70DRAFT_710849 [Pholiota conissans]